MTINSLKAESSMETFQEYSRRVGVLLCGEYALIVGLIPLTEAQWRCSICTYVANPHDRSACQICGSPVDGGKEEQQTDVTPDEEVKKEQQTDVTPDEGVTQAANSLGDDDVAMCVDVLTGCAILSSGRLRLDPAEHRQLAKAKHALPRPTIPNATTALPPEACHVQCHGRNVAPCFEGSTYGRDLYHDSMPVYTETRVHEAALQVLSPLPSTILCSLAARLQMATHLACVLRAGEHAYLNCRNGRSRSMCVRAVFELVFRSGCSSDATKPVLDRLRSLMATKRPTAASKSTEFPNFSKFEPTF